MQQEISISHETNTTILERLKALESRVAALESSPTSSSSGDFWVVDQIQCSNSSDHDHHGSVVFGGAVTLDGREYAYQWERSADYLTGREWNEYIHRIAAIAHPVRGAILRRLLVAPATVAELVDEALVSSTGTAYHHIAALQSAGWIAKLDGRYEVRHSRVIPLLTIIAAGEDH